jgi:hypothetical protein
MSTIATLAVKLIGDITGYTKSMTDAEKQAQNTANKIGKSLQDAGKNITNLGKTATVGLTLPLIAAGGFAINAASDFEETKNKVSVVFGDMTQSVMDWSQNSATAMGISRQQALETAGTYGNLFLTLGLGQKPAAEMSTSLVQLASDLASFNNANPEDVLQSLQSGLVGQVEPMRKFGVNLSEAAVSAKAMQMGLADAEGKLTEAAKVQARYALILEQTTTAQGDFARTADGLANSTRTAKAQLSDAAAVLGQQLLPFALQAVQWISKLVGQFQALNPEQQKTILIVAGIAAAIGPVLVIVGSLITAIGAIIPVAAAVAGALSGVALPILAIVAVLALLYLAWTNNWGGIQEKTQAVIAFLKGVIQSGMQFINDLTSGKLGALSQLWNNTMGTIQALWTLWTTNIKLIFQAFSAAFHGDWYTFGAKLRMVWDNTWTAIKLVLQMAWQNIKIIVSTLITNIINFFRTTDWGAVGRGIIEGIANGIRNGVGAIVNAAKSAAQAALQAAKGFLGIRSPSKLFELQVGMQMAAGAALGWERGLDKMMMPAFGLLQPDANVAIGGQPAVFSGGGVGGGAMGAGSDDRMVALLEEIADKNRIDYVKLARVVRDAVLMRSQ